MTIRAMKNVLILLLIFGFRQTLLGQYDAIADRLPEGFKRGVVIYKYTDSSFFVFKVNDYIESIGGIEPINKDSSWYQDYINLRDTLYRAKERQYSTVNNLYTRINNREYKIFPNSAVLIELFSSHKIILFSKTSDGFQRINYKNKKRQSFFYVIQKRTKKIFFEIGY